jgi:hypothetical protein
MFINQIEQNTHNKTRKHSSSPNQPFLRWLPKPHGLPIKEASKERLHEEALFITPSLTPKK